MPTATTRRWPAAAAVRAAVVRAADAVSADRAAAAPADLAAAVSAADGGGFGGPGGRGGRDGAGRGGPGGRNANAFGNGRRNARMRYNGNLAIIEGNSALNARQYSLTGQDTPKPSTQNARVTAMFGGPLKIPRPGQRPEDDFQRQLPVRAGAHRQYRQHAAADRRRTRRRFFAGDHPEGQPVTIYDPTTGAAVYRQRHSARTGSARRPRDCWPSIRCRTSPAIQRYNYQTSLVGANNQDNVNSRISHTLNSKNQFSGNFSYQRANGTAPNLFGFVTSSHQSAYNTGVNWTYHFTTRLINTLGFTFSRNTPDHRSVLREPRQCFGTARHQRQPPGPELLGSADPLVLERVPGLVRRQQGAESRADLGSQRERPLVPRHAQLHVRRRLPARAEQSAVAIESARHVRVHRRHYLAQRSRRLRPRGLHAGSAGHQQDRVRQRRQVFPQRAGSRAYATDDWRISTKLSLNLGLRWDYQSPTTELYGRLVNLNIGPGFSTANTVCATNVAGCTPASQVGYPNSLVHADPREFQPRIGYAWRPLTKGSLVIRGGYGIYYNTSVYQALVSQMSQQSPLSYSLIDSATQRRRSRSRTASRCSPDADHDFRGRPEFPDRLRAELADVDPAEPAVGAGRDRDLLGREGNAPGAGVHPELGAAGNEACLRDLPDELLLHDLGRQHHREQSLAAIAAAFPQRLLPAT